MAFRRGNRRKLYGVHYFQREIESEPGAGIGKGYFAGTNRPVIGLAVPLPVPGLRWTLETVV
jgi:hypothetical protein